jgi:hypothetical protein
MLLAKPVPRVYQAANSVGTEHRSGRAHLSQTPGRAPPDVKRMGLVTCRGLIRSCKGK